jgi:hypothetical protein
MVAPTSSPHRVVGLLLSECSFFEHLSSEKGSLGQFSIRSDPACHHDAHSHSQASDRLDHRRGRCCLPLPRVQESFARVLSLSNSSPHVTADRIGSALPGFLAIFLKLNQYSHSLRHRAARGPDSGHHLSLHSMTVRSGHPPDQCQLATNAKPSR